jgi:hypothetical protein
LLAAGRLSEQPAQAPLLHRVMGACHDALGNVADADLAYDRALAVARQRGAAHEIAFTVAAIAERTRRAGRAVDEALLAEILPLQRRLGLVLDLTDDKSDAQPSTETSTTPAQKSRLGVAVTA